MAEPTLDQRSPVVRLKFEADDTRNYNWNKLDDTIGRAFTPGSPLQLPPITGSILAPGSAVHGVWVGTAIGTSTPLSGTPTKLAEVLTSSQEDTARWSIVVAQVTVTIGFGAPNSAPIADISLELHRGNAPGTSVHTRELFWNATTMGAVSALGIDVPTTLLLIGKPLDASAAWSVWGSGSISGGAVASVSSAQVYTIQFT